MRAQHLFLYIIATFLIVSCAADEPIAKDLSKEAIIPIPMSMTATGLSFEITKGTHIYANADLKVAQYLADDLNDITSSSIEVKPMSSKPSDGYIHLIIDESMTGSPEAYALEVTPEAITIKSSSEHGLFNGIQTLKQMIPVAKSEINNAQPILVASGNISDSPRYSYRGAMLDVARHFFQVKDVKRYIDLLAAYKINTLHLHLSDDQGWRIEIKKWPNLTTHGGKTQVGGGKGGFYTQEQYKDIVKYAQDRFITVVPEIDMPGHTNAALASYPELNCNGKSPKLYTGMKVGFSTLCTDKEIVYTFIDDVIKELSAMTPGEYIHIGGDESHVTALEDYIPFINRVQKIVTKYDKKVLGWDEIAHATLEPGAVVQYWAEAKNAKKGIAQGAKVLMSPAQKAYLDMQYDSTSHLGLHWAAYIEIDSAYLWDPANLASGISESDILGVESPLWSETIETMDDIEYLAFPRLVGHAEIGWSPQSKRNWEGYKSRLAIHGQRLSALGVDFYKSKLIPWSQNTNVITP